ncbi:MAG: CHAT domain-containing protein [Cyanobacteria bacterium P01_A01_bin.135]
MKEVVKKTVLILAANPKGKDFLRLQEEEREIRERLRFSGRDEVIINSAGACRPKDIQQAMLDFKPDIVHFCGHGSESGLSFKDDSVKEKIIDSEALAQLFRLFSSIECVILNACYSISSAELIAQHVDYVIGMSQDISDRAAIAFAVGFYNGLGAGESVDFAYELGCNSIFLEGISENLVPAIVRKADLLLIQKADMLRESFNSPKSKLDDEHGENVNIDRTLSYIKRWNDPLFSKSLVLGLMRRIRSTPYEHKIDCISQATEHDAPLRDQLVRILNFLEEMSTVIDYCLVDEAILRDFFEA